jgi:hypothetical protein
MPKALHLLESAGPETLKLARQAFDEAWQAIEGNYGESPLVESVRLRLASYILRLISEGERDLAKVRDGAIAGIARDEQPLKFDPTKRK